MKILVVGEGGAAIHEVAVVDAFRKLGHQVEAFYWKNYFSANNIVVRLWRRIQNKFIFGPRVNKLNADLVTKATQFIPELIFIYRGTHVFPSTISELKRELPNCKVFGYNNDDPFASGHPPWLWRYFVDSLSIYDVVFAYRKHNIDDFLRAGAKRVELLMPWFIPEKDRPIVINDKGGNGFLYDVVFVGHYENDHRLIYLKTLAESGVNFRLFGPDWDRAPKFPWFTKLGPIKAVKGEEYNRTLCSARIAICFFSKLNRDTYTRRCFEIPAMKTFMLCEYSDEITNLFTEGEEADFFRSTEEMMAKINKYLNDDHLRAGVANAGFKRVYQDGHDVVSRMRLVVERSENFNAEI